MNAVKREGNDGLGMVAGRYAYAYSYQDGSSKDLTQARQLPKLSLLGWL
jgi:hypothetical protein